MEGWRLRIAHSMRTKFWKDLNHESTPALSDEFHRRWEAIFRVPLPAYVAAWRVLGHRVNAPPPLTELQVDLSNWELWFDEALIPALDAYLQVALAPVAGGGDEQHKGVAETPEETYLDLVVDSDRRVVRRKGMPWKHNLVKLTNAQWSLFKPLFQAREGGVSWNELENAYAGKKSAFRQALSQLRSELSVIDVTVTDPKDLKRTLVDSRSVSKN